MDTIWTLVQKLDPARPWVDSSPSNGMISLEPYAKRWGDVWDSRWGDVHFYDYSKARMVKRGIYLLSFWVYLPFRTRPFRRSRGRRRGLDPLKLVVSLALNPLVPRLPPFVAGL